MVVGEGEGGKKKRKDTHRRNQNFAKRGKKRKKDVLLFSLVG